jgi:hypothetical protein
MMKRIMSIIAIIAIVLLVAGAVIGSQNGWFTKEAQTGTPIDGTEATDSTTETTNPTEGQETTDSTESTEPQEEITTEVKIPFTFAEFYELATTDGAWNVAPEKAVIFDMTADEFVAENEDEQKEFVAVMLRVNPYGAMSIVQNGFESLENHAGEAVAPIFELCNCKVGHNDSWNSDMGQFHWHVAEGNQSLGAKSWTRMTGEMQEYLMSFENREVIRNVACYWFVENEAGEQEVVYGIRVCGDQKDPEPPAPPVEDEKEDEVKEFAISFNFVAANGNKLPNGVTNQLPKSVNVKEGETYKVNFTFKAVETEAGTWTFKSWDKTSVKVTGNVTITGTWTFTEKPGEGDAPEKEQYTVTFKFSGNNLPKEVTNLLPAAKTVEEGTKVTAPTIQNTVKVSGGTWTFNGWDKTTVTVTSNVTITGSWTFKADEQPPVTKEYTVSYKFVGSKGESLPQEVLNQLPATSKVKEGTIVTPKAPAVQTVEVSDGTWTFVGYNKSSANVTSNVEFVGTWKYKEKLTLADPVEDYLVTFKFSATNGTLPSSVKNLQPAAVVAQKGDKVTAPSIKPIVEVDGGAWHFNGWSSNTITVVGDATITGTWTFEKDPEPEHTPPESSDEDSNPVADNQEELDGLGDRTDEVPQNNPEHSDREELSLMPVVEEEKDLEDDVNDGINNQHSTIIDDGARAEVDNTDDDKERNDLSLMPVEGEADSAAEGKSDDLSLSLDLPVDDSEVADQETQDALNAMFGGRE